MQQYERLLALAATLFATACSPNPAANAPPAAGATVPSTRYRQGDHIIYKYSGTYSATPVVMREEVKEQTGNRLVIQVDVKRGDEQRAWLQVVTDTPENPHNDKVDELYALVGGEKRRLANDNNQDLMRLYAWIMPPLSGAPHDVTRTPGERSFAGRSYSCSIEAGVFGEGEAALTFELATCPDFLWTNASGYVRNSQGEVVWARDVLEF